MPTLLQYQDVLGRFTSQYDHDHIQVQYYETLIVKSILNSIFCIELAA